MVRSPGRRLHHFVVGDLINQIGSGALEPGDVLPTETELCENFQVSRSVVRDAVRVLVEKGLVDVRAGRGTTVRPLEQWNLIDPLVLQACVYGGRFVSILDEVLELRTVLEVQIADLAARKATTGEIAELGRIVSELAASVDDPVRFSELDNHFHESLAATVKNSLLSRVAEPVFNLLRAGRQVTNSRGQNLHASQRGHEAIFEAIARRDPDGAQRAMASHIALFEESTRDALPRAMTGARDFTGPPS